MANSNTIPVLLVMLLSIPWMLHIVDTDTTVVDEAKLVGEFIVNKTQHGINYCKYAYELCIKLNRNCTLHFVRCEQLTAQWYDMASITTSWITQFCSEDARVNCTKDCNTVGEHALNASLNAYNTCTAGLNTRLESCKYEDDDKSCYGKSKHCIEKCGKDRQYVDAHVANCRTNCLDAWHRDYFCNDCDTEDCVRDRTKLLINACEKRAEEWRSENKFAGQKEKCQKGCTDPLKSCMKECDDEVRDAYAKCQKERNEADSAANERKNACDSDCNQKKAFCLAEKPPQHCKNNDGSSVTDEHCITTRHSECEKIRPSCSIRLTCGISQNDHSMKIHWDYRANRETKWVFLENCVTKMEECANQINRCIGIRDMTCDNIEDEEIERGDCGYDNVFFPPTGKYKLPANINPKCVHKKLCEISSDEYYPIPEKVLPACEWKEDLAEKETDVLVRKLDAHLKENKMIVRTFDDDGNIIINGGFPKSVRFPMLFKEGNANLSLTVCEIPDSTCKPMEETTDGTTVLTLKFEGTMPCEVARFSRGTMSLEKGKCRTGTWLLDNGAGSLELVVKIKSGERCKLAVKIESKQLEICTMDWQLMFFSDNSEGLAELEQKQITSVGTSITTTNFNRNSNSTGHEIGHEDNWYNRNAKTDTKTRKDTNKVSNEYKVTVGTKASAGASFQHKSAATNGSGDVGLTAEQNLEAGYTRGWEDQSNKYLADENGFSLEGWGSTGRSSSVRNTFSTEVEESMTSTTTVTMETTVKVAPGTVVTTEQLTIICDSGVMNQSPFYRSYMGDRREGNELSFSWTNVTTQGKNTTAPENVGSQLVPQACFCIYLIISYVIHYLFSTEY